MLDTVDFNHVQHISFTQSRLTDAVSVILSELLSYEHPPKQVELFPSLYLTCMLQTSKGTYQHTDDENLVCTFSIQASPKIKTRQLTSAARFLQRQLLQGQYRSNKLQCLHS